MSAQGTFTDNVITAYASGGSSTEWLGAIGIGNCDGIFERNTITVSVAYQYAQSSIYGMSYCTGTCLFNSINIPMGGWTSPVAAGISGFTGEVRNCTITQNYCIPLAFTGIANVTPGPVSNCIITNFNIGFSGNYEIRYSDVYNCNTPYGPNIIIGPGNIQSDPLLVNTWFLSPGSPCIDAGDPASPLDPDCTRADMGAHFYDQRYVRPQPRVNMDNLKGFQVWPNPFNPSTVASFELRVPSRVNLKVYDTAGRLVATLADGWRGAGSHEVTFDPAGASGSRLASGLYFVRMQAGEYSAVRKMMLLK
jgi:hypothetical protein